MEKCIANVKENHKEKESGEEDTGRPQRLQSPYFLLSAPASVTCLPTFLLPKPKFYMPLRLAVPNRSPKQSGSCVALGSSHIQGQKCALCMVEAKLSLIKQC